jgi:hypothetical protein
MSQHRSQLGCAPSGMRRVRVMASVALALATIAGISASPTASAQFPQPARPPKTVADSPKMPAASLPSARSILDHHVVAIGGREAVLSHTSMYVKGTLSMPSAGMSGTLEMYGATPNKSLLKISLGGVGEVVEGFDGTHGWSLSPMTGPMVLEGKQLEEKRFDAEFHSELRSEARYSSMTTLEQTDFEGRPCYKIRLVRKTGGEDTEFYDVQTGLKAGSITTRETQMGTVTGTTVATDYRKFGNLLQPTTVRSQIGAVQQLITIDTIEYDRVPPSVFDMPTGIKALVK